MTIAERRYLSNIYGFVQFVMLTFILFSDRTETTLFSTNPINSEVYDYITEDTHDERNEGKNYYTL